MILHRNFKLKSITKSKLFCGGGKYTAADKAHFQKSQLVCGGVGGKSPFERVGNYESNSAVMGELLQGKR